MARAALFDRGSRMNTLPKGRRAGHSAATLTLDQRQRWLAWFRAIETKYRERVGPLVTGNRARFKDVSRMERPIEWGLMLARAYDVLFTLEPFFRDLEERALLASQPDLTDAATDPARRVSLTRSAAKAIAARPTSEPATDFVPGLAYSIADSQQLAEYFSAQAYLRKSAGALTPDELTRVLADAFREAHATGYARFAAQLPPDLQARLAAWYRATQTPRQSTPVALEGTA